MATTLLRAEGAAGAAIGARGALLVTVLPPAGRGSDDDRGGGVLARPGGGVIDPRPEAASRMIAARSGSCRAGRHSSCPSCQQRESSVTAPSEALRRTSEILMGPTGTPLMATYQVSSGASSDMSNGVETSSSFWTLLLKAPASALAGGEGFAGGLAPSGARGGVPAMPPVARGMPVGFGGGLEVGLGPEGGAPDGDAAGGRRLGRDARLGDRRANLDEVSALAALHSHGLADDLLVGNLVFGLALVAEELHRGATFATKLALGRPFLTAGSSGGRSAQINFSRCSLIVARVSSSGAAASERSQVSTALFLKQAFS